ncbi:MAG TPA: LptE family protein [Terriglobales bacterium]|nr:LptE family protein [Terriglobales bacterium]
MIHVARAPSLAMRAESLGLWAGIFFCFGCGYHTAGHNAAIPLNIRTIAVPAFVNQTHTYKIEQMLTTAVVREMVTRTNYHVVSKADGDADATLHGTVLSTYTTPLTYDSTTGRAASILVVISMSVSLQEKDGKMLYENPSYLFREQYEVSRDPNAFFEEDTPAFQRLSRDFAQTLVSNILEGF